ncbi:ATP-binding cassette, subfamily F, member 3 [Hathewaya proteolytica DSM 3090]|uniref:ATP-binding cassette, subfamily F, member 3 n=1 Tax=Hathewaya proteolytica DSM 3090 TaxID=1121331 RepID=A0A1M6KE60_9CLOT|nr:ABC-F family ATP-binding cassette domain-containing protein [Hathewaya proteolytica]SHJ57209.1 ATP-binding cassette, subfamily F, member 3 [Hathewaya proteolytica DSM 3090]
MTVLSCKNIKKAYGITEILKDVTFSINEGDKVGLVGPNGAGKSTLFKILTNALEHDSGEIYIDKNKELGYLSQDLSLDSDNTIYDELLLVFSDLTKLENKIKAMEAKLNSTYDGCNEDEYNKLIHNYTTSQELFEIRGGYTYKAEIYRVLYGLGFEEDDFTKHINILSGGQKTRVALCKLLLHNPQILLLDEPTNHLDLSAIEWLEDYLKSYKGSVLIISHDRYFLDAITNKTIELNDGCIDEYKGNYSSFIELRKKKYEEKLKAYENQQLDIKRQEEIIKKYKSFNREKSIRAAESRQKALDKVERLDAPKNDLKLKHFSFQTQIQSGNDVLMVENLSKSFGDKQLFTDLSFQLIREDKVALIGDNGRGKTTFFKILMDTLKPDSGRKFLGKNVEIGYYDQEQSNLHHNKNILEEVWDDYPELTMTELRSALAAFLFFGDDVFKEVGKLSGGEKCRINLLKLMLSKSNLLLLDEPTNHLDIMSREALESALLSYDGTILVISHDRYFLNKVVNKIYELQLNGVTEYLGNYSYYVEKKRNPMRFQPMEEENNGITKTQLNNDKKKKRELEKEAKQKQLQLKNTEKEIAKLEEEIEILHCELCKEEIYSNPEKSMEVNASIAEKEASLAELYEKWEELC